MIEVWISAEIILILTLIVFVEVHTSFLSSLLVSDKEKVDRPKIPKRECPNCGEEGVKPDKDLTASYGEVKWHCVNPDCRVMTFEKEEEDV